MNAPLQSIRSAPAADVGDSQQKCSNLMEWGGAKSVSARGAGVVRECSTGRPERYEHQECPRIHAARGTAAAFYTIHHIHNLAAHKTKENTLIIIRGSPAIYEARCPGDESRGAKEDVEAARRRRPAQQANENKHHPHRDTASPPASARRPSRGCATQQRRRTNSRPSSSAASS